ncbi:MAG TPA: ComEC/Rec2 family competence protein [Patescibacteria group bacterium]|jgi:competence protein ComEC|nr:ComEC/Rec2 family competence protein [Patescibacteria group bacterium]
MLIWRYRKVRRTTLISLWSLAILAGLGTVQIGLFNTSLTILMFSGMLLFFCLKKWWLLSIPAVIISGLLLGIWRGSVIQQQLNFYKPLVNHKVTLQSVIRDDPTIGNRGQIDMRVEQLVLNDNPMPGSARITSLQQLQPRRGDTIKAIGKLREGFGGYQIEIIYAKVQIITEGTAWSEKIRRIFSTAVFANIPDPQASLGLGFLIGLKAMLPKTLDDQLKVLGLTHIVVASGYNLTVLVRAARRLSKRRSKFQTTALSSLMIAGFLAITGFSSSMSRAALVSGLSILAGYYGRQIHPLLLIVFTAAATALVSPLYIWSDVGWYLSFLSFGGVLLLGPLAERRLFGQSEPPLLVQIAIETTSAQIVTLPLIMFVFGQFSTLSLISNMLIEPFIPLAMLLTFIVGIVGLTLPALAPLVGLPTTLLLDYMTNLSGWLSKAPWAQLPITISATGMIIFYGLILTTGYVLFKQTKYNYLEART